MRIRWAAYGVAIGVLLAAIVFLSLRNAGGKIPLRGGWMR